MMGSRIRRLGACALGAAALVAVMAGPAGATTYDATVSPDPLVRGGNATVTISCPGYYNEFGIIMEGIPSGNGDETFGDLDQLGYAQVVVSLDFLDPADTEVFIEVGCHGEGNVTALEHTYDVVDPPATTTPPPTVAPAVEAPAAPVAEPAELPRTGSNVGLLSVIAVLTLAGGIALVVRTRIRHA